MADLSDRSKAILSAFLVLFLIAVLGLVAEGVVRVRQYVKYGTFGTVSEFQMDADTGLRTPPPGMQTAHIGINSLGFRGPELEVPKPEGRLRLAFMGASTTYCAEVSSNEHAWPAIVARELRSRFSGLSVDYVNAGVPGYTSASSLQNFQSRVAPLKPDVVVIYHATNDLSAETRELAAAAGIGHVNLDTEQSWLGKYSLLWYLAEKNLALMNVQQPNKTETLDFAPLSLGNAFRQNLEELVKSVQQSGASVAALVTFSSHLREGMTKEQQDKAMESARYYMPYMSPEGLLAGFVRYNQSIREVAAKTGAVLIEDESSIPGDSVHFADSVHFTDTGSQRQAERVTAGLVAAPSFSRLFDKTNKGPSAGPHGEQPP